MCVFRFSTLLYSELKVIEHYSKPLFNLFITKKHDNEMATTGKHNNYEVENASIKVSVTVLYWRFKRIFLVKIRKLYQNLMTG